MAKAPEGDSPAAVFARQLWSLKQRAGNPSYDTMRRDHGALASKSALSAAARGACLPSWDTTWEFVRPLAVTVLGQDEQRVRTQWRRRWDQASAAVLAKAVPVEPPPASPRFGRYGRWVLGAAATIATAAAVLLTMRWPRPEAPVPATIAEPCPATWLCLYRNIGFDDMNFQTQRQNFCWRLADYYLQDAVYSYDNNLPIAAYFYDPAKNRLGDVRADESSHDSSSLPGAYWFCTGSARP